MTEAEWDACADPAPMLEFLRGKVSDRKLRLFACACFRTVWPALLSEDHHNVVEVAEAFVEGRCMATDLLIAGLEATEWTGAAPSCVDQNAHTAAVGSVAGSWHLLEVGYRRACVEAKRVMQEACAQARRGERGRRNPSSEPPGGQDAYMSAMRVATDASVAASTAQARVSTEGLLAEREHILAVQAALLRDSFGPWAFRAPPAVSRSWLAWNDGTARKLAELVYEERALPTGTLDPARLALLADALEDAGCSDADILNHCRGTGPHVRGCWVVDLLLGKE